MNINSLYENARSGDLDARDQLFKFLSVRFRLIAYQRIWSKSDSEDVAQEALMVVAQNIMKIDIRKSFSAWAGKILDNRILTYINKKQSQQTLKNELQLNSGTSGTSNPSYDLKRRLITCLKKIELVNSRYFRILNLHGQGYSTDEVCTMLKIKPSNCYVILSRARSMLEKCLETGDFK